MTNTKRNREDSARQATRYEARVAGLVAVMQAALRDGTKPSTEVYYVLEIEIESAIYHRARADGRTNPEAMELSRQGRAEARELVEGGRPGRRRRVGDVPEP